MKKTSKPSPSSEGPPNLAQILYEKIEAVKKSHPEVSRKIDDLEEEIRDSMKGMKAQIEALDSREAQKLLTVLLINDIHRSVEGILTAGLGAE